MSQTFEAPYAGRLTKSNETLNGLVDDLLERYLCLLDQYQNLQQSISRHLSDVCLVIFQFLTVVTHMCKQGFLALAQANFSNPNRIRYGQDFFDDRMQASIYVYVSLWETNLNVGAAQKKLMPPYSIIKHVNPVIKIGQAPAAVSLSQSDDQEQTKTQAPTTSDEDCHDQSKAMENEPELRHNPLRWFGILVPPALRASQSSFKNATIDGIVPLANTIKDMQDLEIEIKRARKQSRKADRNTDPSQTSSLLQHQ